MSAGAAGPLVASSATAHADAATRVCRRNVGLAIVMLRPKRPNPGCAQGLDGMTVSGGGCVPRTSRHSETGQISTNERSDTRRCGFSQRMIYLACLRKIHGYGLLPITPAKTIWRLRVQPPRVRCRYP